MASTESVRAVVDLEDREPAILFSKFPGTDIHMWPYLRWPLVQSMAAVELGSVQISSPISTAQRMKKLVSRVLPNPSSTSHVPRGRELLFVVAGRTQADTPIGRKNWLVDDFASLYPDQSVVVQYRELGTPADPAPRRTFEKTFSFHDAELKADIAARIRPLSGGQRRSTENAVASVFAELNFPVNQGGIAVATAKVLRHQARVERMREQYEELLDRIEPKIIIMDGACYGGSRAIQVRAAKERGIRVAEAQHGWVGKSHGAYNFGQAMWRNEMKQYVPDTLLTFGDYWSRGVTGPFDTVAVGKPHLEQLAAQAPPIADRARAVLVVSSVDDRSEMVRAVLSLRESLPEDWRVLFRPHPSEWATVDRMYPELVAADRVEIDRTLDVYESLGSVRGVFGYSSTVLYEALKFGCRTFIFDSIRATHYSDNDVLGAPITDQAALHHAISVLASDSPAAGTSQLDDLWSPDSLGRFRRFAEGALPHSNA